MAHEACMHEKDFGGLKATLELIMSDLKDLKELLVSNAALSEQYSQVRDDINDIFDRLHKLELETAHRLGANKWLDKAVWMIVAAAITAYVTTHMGHIFGG